jgi:7-cyano-7-deazaguanine tRNA-ribosyltransferase
LTFPEFEIKDVDLGGRIGKLKLKEGRVVDTPAFFPVVDPLRQEVPLNDIEKVGFKQIITNAYLALKRSKDSVYKDIHQILGWRNAIMMDSGGYQILEYGDINVTQDEVLEFQKLSKTDIGVILDVPTGLSSWEEAKKTVIETLARAKKALNVIDPVNDEILWVLPIQGGAHLDLLEYSARESDKLPYKMLALGSPTVFLERYKYDIIVEMIYTVKKNVNPAKPLHLFGAGHPLIIPFAIALGVDTFDSASYIFYARDGRYMTETGVYRIEELDYLPCSCPICRKYTIEEIRELDHAERTRLLALHNLYVIKKVIEETKQAIREGRLWELLERFSRNHPKAYATFLKFRKYYKLLEKGVSLSAPKVKGLRVFGYESLWNPKLIKFKSKILSRYLDFSTKLYSSKVVILKPMPKDPSLCEEQRVSGEYLVYYSPFLGVVPAELCGVYPTIHAE